MATPLAPTRVLVGTTQTAVLSSTPARQGCVFQNLSAVATISLALGGNQTPVLGQGITLTPGGTWSMDPNTVTHMTISAIASHADTPLSIQEFV